MSDKNSLLKLYEANWKSMEGLQMAPEAADLGYRLIGDLPKGKALDIGCGDGTNALKLKELGFVVDGCEISLNAVKKAQKKGIPVKQVDLNTEKLPYKNGDFNLVWMTDVIEHVFWPDNLLAEAYRVLQKGGYLYLTTPNVIWWGIRLQIMLGKTLKDIHPEHIHWFNRRMLLHILDKQKFNIEKEFGYNCYVPHPLAYKFSLLRSFNRIGSLNDFFTYTLIILAKK